MIRTAYRCACGAEASVEYERGDYGTSLMTRLDQWLADHAGHKAPVEERVGVLEGVIDEFLACAEDRTVTICPAHRFGHDDHALDHITAFRTARYPSPAIKRLTGG